MALLRCVLAVVLGLVVGSVVNMALVMLGGHVVAPPPGADLATVEGLRAALPAMRPVHFLFPFLAHALGTLAGAYVATRVASCYKRGAALAVGALFFAGGIMAARMIPAPAWFIALDLLLAYLPMAWLAIKTGQALAARGSA